jgi:WD40 repeat protein
MEVMVQPGEVFAAHTDCVYALAKGPGSGSFYSSGADGRIIEWAQENPEIARLKGEAHQPIYALTFLEPTGILVAGLKDGGMHFIDVQEKKVLRSVQVHHRSLFDMVELPGQRVLVVSADGSLSLWNSENFECMLQAHVCEQNLRAVAISLKAGLVAFGGSDALVRVYSLDSFKLIKVLEGHTLSVFSLAFSPEGNYLVSAGRDARFRVWNTKEFQLEDIIPAHLYAIHHVVFSPDGKWLASGSMDKSIKIWDAESLKLVKVIEQTKMPAHTSSVNRLLWLDSETLISASDDRKIRSHQILVSP